MAGWTINFNEQTNSQWLKKVGKYANQFGVQIQEVMPSKCFIIQCISVVKSITKGAAEFPFTERAEFAAGQPSVRDALNQIHVLSKVLELMA